MTSVLDDGPAIPVSSAVFANPRVVFTPTPQTDGFLDGAWWPRTRALSVELPTLLAAVATRFGPVARVSLNTTAWDSTPREMTCSDGVVQVVWFRARDAYTIKLLGAENWHLDVLVIPPDTAADTAAAALSGVALRHSIAALHAILSPASHPPTPCLTLVSPQPNSLD